MQPTGGCLVYSTRYPTVRLRPYILWIKPLSWANHKESRIDCLHAAFWHIQGTDLQIKKGKCCTTQVKSVTALLTTPSVTHLFASFLSFWTSSPVISRGGVACVWTLSLSSNFFFAKSGRFTILGTLTLFTVYFLYYPFWSHNPLVCFHSPAEHPSLLNTRNKTLEF